MSRIPHSRPFLPAPEEWAEITRRLSPGWIADGPCVDAFVRAASPWMGGTDTEARAALAAPPPGVAVNSGTSALHLALSSVLSLSSHRRVPEVLVPAYCCAALLHAVALAGARPVLVDAEPDGVNLCAEDARRRMTPRTAAVIVAHMFGRPAPIAPFLALGVPVIEDCAQSLGAREGDALTGSRGAVAITSFYATKVITTGHGGMVTARDPARLAELHDRVDYDNRDDWNPRVNYRMSELQAALGLWQLERLPSFLARRRALAEQYDRELSQFSDRSSSYAPESGCAVRRSSIDYRYILRVPDADAIICALQARGVDAKRPVWRPLHQYLGGDYPHAQRAHDQIVSLPLYPALTDGEAERVVAEARTVLATKEK